MRIHAIVLAAGEGTRMNSPLAKVLHRVAGRPLIGWTVEALASAGVPDTVVVVGHQADDVAATLPEGTTTVIQEQRNGTAHATSIALGIMDMEIDDTVVVLPGDMPLITPATISGLITTHVDSGADATLLSAIVDDPTGYGRVIRDSGGSVTAVVEHADATAAQHEIDEVATAVYAFRAGALVERIAQVTAENAQGEYYLPDVIGLIAADGGVLGGVVTSQEEGMGVNSVDQLADAGALLRDRINRDWMRAGVWMLDPTRVYLDATVELEPGVRLYPGVHLEGSTRVAAGTEIGPDVFAVDSTIGASAKVWYAVLRDVVIGDGVEVGPYASLRPGTVMAEGSKAGTFVEIKNSEIGPQSKVPHLSYIGDATIGTGSNVGAGTITVNYDGFRKHRTLIGDGVRIGSDTMLVAPVEIGDGAYTGAGSVITKDVGAGALAVERSHQKEIQGYAERRRRNEEGHA